MKKGFTLAEVLIAIAIVGVVAAITIPTLISNIQKRVLVVQFKESYSILAQGVKLLLADEDSDRLSATSVWSSLPDNGCIMGKNCSEEFMNGLRKYIKFYDGSYGAHPVKYLNFDGEEFLGVSATLHNGAMLLAASPRKVPNNVACCGAYVFPFMIDVNGKKGPNQFGRDVFKISIVDSGEVIQQYSTQALRNYCKNQTTMSVGKCITTYNGTHTWRNTANVNYNCETKTPSCGYGCGGRILDSGWSMTY